MDKYIKYVSLFIMSLDDSCKKLANYFIFVSFVGCENI